MKNRADKRSGTCSSAAAYIKQCQQAGVELWMPGHCVRCEINRQETMANGESTRIQGNSPQSADVVFIVQQSSCLGDLELQNLPQLVDKSLTNKGLTDNRYALVSFAGSNQLQRPHIVTAASQIFNGVSQDAVITASTLDKDLRRQLKDPKDQVSTLAQESGGAVFDLNRLKSRKRNLAKKATTMMGKALAELSQPLDCEVCDCLADADGKGRVMCHRCVLPSIDIVLQNLEMMLKQ